MEWLRDYPDRALIGTKYDRWVPIILASTGSLLFNEYKQPNTLLTGPANFRLEYWTPGTRWALTCQTVAVDNAGPTPPDVGNAPGDRITDLVNSRRHSVQEKNSRIWPLLDRRFVLWHEHLSLLDLRGDCVRMQVSGC